MQRIVTSQHFVPRARDDVLLSFRTGNGAKAVLSASVTKKIASRGIPCPTSWCSVNTISTPQGTMKMFVGLMQALCACLAKPACLWTSSQTLLDGSKTLRLVSGTSASAKQTMVLASLRGCLPAKHEASEGIRPENIRGTTVGLAPASDTMLP